MKLHLPKQLFTALLAAITLAAPAVKGADGDSTATITYSGTTYTWGGENNDNTYHSGPFTTDDGNTATWETPSQNNNTIKFTAASNDNYESAGFQFSGFSVGGFIVEEGADINLVYAANGSTVTSETGRDITIGKNANENSGTTIKDDFEIKSCGGTIAIGGSQQVWEVEEGNTYTVNSGSGAIKNNCADLVIRSIATADTADSPGEVILKGAFTNNGSLTVNSGATLTLSSTFTNNGTMTVNGNIAISSGSLSNFDRSFDDSSYTTSGSQTVDMLCTLYKGNAINGVTSVTLDSESKNLNEKGQFVVSQTAYVVADNDTVTVGGSSPTEGAGDAALFALADTGTLEFAAEQSGNLVKEVVGNGRVEVTLVTPTSGHGRGVKLGSSFHGTLAVNSGWMDLTTFTTAADATLELHAGQHWSNGGTLTQNIDLKATAADEEYVFRNSATLALTGTVTGDYLNVGTTGNNSTIVELTNSQNKISHAVVGCSNNAATLKLSADMSFDSITTHSNSKVVLTEGKTLSLTDGESSISTIEASGATINLAEGVTLNIGSDSTASTSTIGTVAASGNTIHLNNKATLNHLSSVTGTVTLSGSGVYKLAANTTALTTGVTLGNGWTGTVLLSNVTAAGDLTSLNTLGGKTKLGFQAVGGYLWSSSGTGNLTANLSLINGTGTGNEYAIKLNDGTSDGDANVKFSGKIEGAGDIWYSFSGNKASYTATHEFSGDLSDWDGKFIRKVGSSVGKSVVAKFTSGGNVFQKLENGVGGNGGVEDADNSGKMSVVIEAADGTETFFNGSITNVATLTVNTDTTFNASLTGTGTTITINSNAILSTLSLTENSTITLAGSGTYKLADNATTLTTGVALDETWKGTVELKHTSNSTIEKMDEKLEALGNTSSTVKLSGLSGWFNNGTLDINVDTGEENNTAFTIVNGSCENSGTPLKFNQAISGSGDIVLKGWGGMKSRETFITISGDISEWDGNIYNSTAASNAGIFNINFADQSQVDVSVSNKDKSYGSTTLVFSGSKITEMNGAVNVERVEVKTDTQFNADVTASNTLTVDVGKTATMNATLSAGTVNLGSTATITGKDSGTVSMTKVKMNDTCISSADTTGATKGSISNANVALAQLAEDASFTIQDMTLTNTTITAATTETRVNLSNVSGDATLAKGTFGLQMQSGDPLVGMGDASLSYGVAGTPSLTLGATEASLVITVDPSADANGIYQDYTLTFNLNVNLDSVPVSGEDWKELVGFEGWLGTMLENQGATYQVADGAAQVAEGNSAPTVSYGYAAGDGGSNVGTLTITISGLNVPEPASATLGLAALMMLCARRRRKA